MTARDTTDAERLARYRLMRLSRRFEETVHEQFHEGNVPGPLHLSIGQEAVAVGGCWPLRDTDVIVSTHRGHHHCLAKGAKADRMMAELLGRADGYSLGRGGSMHVAIPEIGLLGTNGIVGGGIPIGTGAALGLQIEGRDDVAVAFFGEGAAANGVFGEALNTASLWKLPVIFICENNKYGMSVSTERSMSVPNVADRAAAYGMNGVIVDGNAVADVAEAVLAAAADARAGKGPTLIECKTYRTRGHSRSDRNRYRTKEEIEEWKSRDPIPLFEADLLTHGVATPDEIAAIRAEAEADIAAGIEFARNGTDPDPADVTRDVYSPGYAA